jgi:hypothetical protein
MAEFKFLHELHVFLVHAISLERYKSIISTLSFSDTLPS